MKRTKEEELDACGKRGARFMDTHCLGWWKNKNIDLDIFDMSYPLHCVLGQTYGHYVKGLQQLNLSKTQELQFGFFTRNKRVYKTLTQCWRREIIRRRKRFRKMLKAKSARFNIADMRASVTAV